MRSCFLCTALVLFVLPVCSYASPTPRHPAPAAVAAPATNVLQNDTSGSGVTDPGFVGDAQRFDLKNDSLVDGKLSLLDNDGFNTPYDTIAAAEARSGETPEPPTLLLLGTALIATGLYGTLNLMRKRYPKVSQDSELV